MQLRFFLIVNKYQIVSAYCIHVKMAETLQISTFSPRSEGIHRVRNGHHIALFLLQGHGLALAFWESVFSCCKASAGPRMVPAHFLCWFSVGKCQVQFRLRGFWQMGWSAGMTQERQTSCDVRTHLLSVSLGSHAYHQSRYGLCTTGKFKGHVIMFYYLTICAVWSKWSEDVGALYPAEFLLNSCYSVTCSPK